MKAINKIVKYLKNNISLTFTFPEHDKNNLLLLFYSEASLATRKAFRLK